MTQPPAKRVRARRKASSGAGVTQQPVSLVRNSTRATTSFAAELHEVTPREQAGAATGERYEFQYHQAAAHCLLVLDDTDFVCLYCEWHDDYVLERARAIAYRFHQVKTRAKSLGPWTLNLFFGIKKRSPAKPASTDSIFARFFSHVSRFRGRCDAFIFVTNGGIAQDLQEFVDGVQAATTVDILPDDIAKTFSMVYTALTTAFAALSRSEFFNFVKRLKFCPALGDVGDLPACRTLIGARIFEFTEVDLTITEAQKIAADLVAAVRERSHRVLSPPPSSRAELRAHKGLMLADVLRLLSLSPAGYEALKTEGRPGVVALSRLTRLCKRSGIAESLIPELCRMKTFWDTWWIEQRHGIAPLDALGLRRHCVEVLRAHAAGGLNFDGLRREAARLALEFAPILASTEPLREEHVFGFMLTLAVEAEQ